MGNELLYYAGFGAGILYLAGDLVRGFIIFTILCLPVIIISGVSSPIVIRKGIEVMGLTDFHRAGHRLLVDMIEIENSEGERS